MDFFLGGAPETESYFHTHGVAYNGKMYTKVLLEKNHLLSIV